MTVSEPGVRPARQQRSRDSQERVLKAAEKLLAEKGYEGFTMTEVAKRAKISVGSVYGRFAGRESLIYAVHARMNARLSTADDTVLAEATDLASALAGAVRQFAATMYRERDLLRVFMLRGAIDEAIRTSGSASSQAAAQLFEQAVLAFRDEIRHPCPGLAVDVAYRIVYDVLARQVMYGPTFESSLQIDWDELVAELTAAALDYLRGSGAAR
jgi:AcrR family transcriptional regulator